MDIETLQKAQAINREMIAISNRAGKFNEALMTIKNGYTSNKLIIHGGMHKVELDPLVAKKALMMSIKELEERYSALAAELKEL